MIAPAPPPRQAHLFDNEQGEPLEQAQRYLLHRLTNFVDPDTNFHGDCSVRLQVEAANDSSTRIAFATDHGNGVIEIALADNGWLRADLILAGTPKLRAWIENAYEELEVWPDGADGAGEAPGRISKRGAWLTIDCARFPGVPANTHGYWQVEAND